MFKKLPSKAWLKRAVEAEGAADIHAGPKRKRPTKAEREAEQIFTREYDGAKKCPWCLGAGYRSGVLGASTKCECRKGGE